MLQREQTLDVPSIAHLAAICRPAQNKLQEIETTGGGLCWKPVWWSMRRNPQVSMVLHVLAAGMCLLCSQAISYRPEIELHWGWAYKPLVATGLAFLLGGILLQRTQLARFAAALCLVCSSLLIAIVLGEVAFRLAGYDFRRQEWLWRKYPPFYRQPMLPTGKAFFRRSGPEQWHGPVIRTWLELSGCDPSPYATEQPIKVKYDACGFRNEPGHSDWEVAVTGDSFTELGSLSYDRLFTTMLGQRLNLRVANLGVSYTGPLAQLHYLEEYGKAPSVLDAVVVFFEGNDLEDVNNEYRALLSYGATGKRPIRQFHKQTSLVRAAGERLRKGLGTSPPAHPKIDAVFESGTGPILVTLGSVPKSRIMLSPFMLEAFDRFGAGYAAYGRRNNIRTWLAYMPCKTRVLFDNLQMTEEAADEVRNWTPTDLPAFVAEFCARHGIKFIDLVPALTEETRRSGALLYNALYDTHLNARGSAIVADELARHLGAQR